MKHPRIAKAALVVAISGGLLATGAASATAATRDPAPSPAATIAPGTTGTVGIRIATPSTTSQSALLGLHFVAPSHATFTQNRAFVQQLIGGLAGPTNPVFTNCTRSQAATVLDCPTGGVTVSGATNGIDGVVKITAQVAIDADAPAGTLFDDGEFGVISSSTQIAEGSGLLRYETPGVADTPIVAPMIAGGAGALAATALSLALLRRRRAR